MHVASASDRRKKYLGRLTNPIPYVANYRYYGHQLHVDLNEKLIINVATHVCSINMFFKHKPACRQTSAKNNLTDKFKCNSARHKQFQHLLHRGATRMRGSQTLHFLWEILYVSFQLHIFTLISQNHTDQNRLDSALKLPFDPCPSKFLVAPLPHQ